MSPSDVMTLAGELMAEYADRVDSDRLEEWLDLFDEQASYKVMPRENIEQGLPASIMYCSNKAMLRDRITSLRQANEYNLHYDRHLITGIRVKPDGDAQWRLEANYLVVQTNLEGESRLFSTGRYLDRVVLSEGKLLLREKLVVVDTFSIPTLLATPL